MPQLKDADDVPIAYIQLSDMRDSGFIQDGSENTPNPIQLKAPSARYIPNTGFRRSIKLDAAGKEIMKRDGTPEYYYEPIRHIRNQPEISVAKQKFLGIEPSPRHNEDKIIIQTGEIVVARDLGNEGLYDYLTQVFYNESVEGRSTKATAIFKTIDKDVDAEVDNDNDAALADVLIYLKGLSTKVGDKLYKYNEEKIDGLCSLFTVFADTYATRLKALTQFAKTVPVRFMEAVTKWEQTTETEVTQALRLNVIKFDKNVAMYVDREKIIKSLGTEKMNQEQKISTLADWLRTSDGHEEYSELKTWLGVAKDKQ